MSTVGSSSQTANPNQAGSSGIPPQAMPSVPNPILQPGSGLSSTGSYQQAPASVELDPETPAANPKPLRSIPSPALESTAASAEDLKQKRRRKLPPEETPDWLPSGWIVEDRVRASGNSAGTTDRYYKDPVSGRTFRSKKEVLYFLQNGSLPKRAKGVNKEGPKVKPKAGGPMVDDENQLPQYDSDQVPSSVTWVLNHLDGDTWIPFVDGQEVPEEHSSQWTSVFKTSCKQKN